MLNFQSAMEIIGSGLNAQRSRMNLLASNLANARTTRGVDGEPYKRLDPVFHSVSVNERYEDLRSNADSFQAYMVEMQEVKADDSAPRELYQPDHPDADENGIIRLPNINVVEEMVNLITASRAYEANVSLMQSVKGMARSAISIGGR